MVSIKEFYRRVETLFGRKDLNLKNVNFDNIIKHIQNETNVSNLVVLVIDPNNQRFGQIGILDMHDWREYGHYYVKFKDGETERYPDGWVKDDPPSPVRTFYRMYDERREHYEKQDCGLSAFKREYLKLNVGNIEKLRQEYVELFGEELLLN